VCYQGHRLREADVCKSREVKRILTAGGTTVSHERSISLFVSSCAMFKLRQGMLNKDPLKQAPRLVVSPS
jgi:hypothetical protein